MRKQWVIVVIIILLLSIGLSGCTDNTGSNEGDTHQIQIVTYELIKERLLLWESRPETFNPEDTITWDIIVPWNLDISNVSNNLTKRKYICDNYIDEGIPSLEHPVNWDTDYWGYIHPISLYHNLISNIRLDDSINSWRVTGTAKNIGDTFLEHPKIIINLYNENDAWLAKLTAFENDIPSGYTWDFDERYSGEFKNDVSYISFEVDANPYD